MSVAFMFNIILIVLLFVLIVGFIIYRVKKKDINYDLKSAT